MFMDKNHTNNNQTTKSTKTNKTKAFHTLRRMSEQPLYYSLNKKDISTHTTIFMHGN